ncbi:hypothetical protein M433DRAFT_62584 [Acidomyces richmondensis BFW]|nr:hypothetical protein M433DRAFT_62584 [Acidomyces richmondensis BFW]
MLVEPETNSEHTNVILETVLPLLGICEEQIALAAQDVVYKFLKSRKVLSDSEMTSIWAGVRNLIDSGLTTFHANLGYDIWLRCINFTLDRIQLWFETEYWRLLRSGLQTGDGERRKKCLEIIRCSVIVAAKESTLRQQICSRAIGDESANNIVEQYERYCTVFETILLGRYLNQVMACTPDLDLLASPQSIVQSEWLYSLLIAALAPQIQDSNRRYIGNWIMRSNFQPSASETFVQFFRDGFLPWVTQGSLFTATLRRHGDQIMCLHGNLLTNYISSLLGKDFAELEPSTVLLDTILAFLSETRYSNFAYASVYMLDGIGRAIDSASGTSLTIHQLESLLELSSWSNFPEVARDFVLVRCLKMCSDSLSRASQDPPNKSIAEALHKWNMIYREILYKGKTLSTVGGFQGDMIGPISSWHSAPSERSRLEHQTIQKCQELRNSWQSDKVLQPSDTLHQLQEVWSDFEYLEYPKSLSLSIAKVVLDENLIDAAISCNDLSATINNMVCKLQSLSQTRVYLLPPLVQALRNIMLLNPSAAKFIPLKDIILKYTECLPEPTVDLKLEDCTSGLMQGVGPIFAPFGYEYYFQNRRSLGVAAILDLVSRLHHQHSTVAESMLQSLVERWRKQKTPPPTVSVWKSTLQLQVVLLCSELITPSMESSRVSRMLQDLHWILSVEPLPRYRYLLSWIIARIYLNRQELRPCILIELSTKDHHSNPKYLAALIKIAVMLAKTEASSAHFCTELAWTLIPLAASSKIVIRHEAQWQIPLLMDYAKKKGFASISENPSFVALDGYIRTLDRFDDPPIDRQIDRLDPVKDHNMVNLVDGRWFGLDDTESPSCSRTDFIRLFKLDHNKMPQPCIELGELDMQPINKLQITCMEEFALPNDGKAELTPSKAGGTRALQTKGTAYLNSDTHKSEDWNVRRESLIVVASLVDNPHNLGGLSRVSEVFGASELHLQNQNVTSNKDFSNVSVSSHLHFPILQLSANAVPAYLAEKREAGWTVVGIEQTDRSTLLGSPECILPEKVVLVIGSEKKGIPAAVLSECSMLVEIPQQGVTRSLNVQTAAGIFLYEYAKQHRIIPPQ